MRAVTWLRLIAQLNVALAIRAVLGIKAFTLIESDPKEIRYVLVEGADLSREVRDHCKEGLDAVLELVGNTTLLTSMSLVRPGGRVCLAGFLGGLAPMREFNPLMQMPSRIHFSFFGSFVFGTPGFPLSDVPMQEIVDRAEAGKYRVQPARVFGFTQIAEAHRVMEAGEANGKLVVVV